MHLRTILLLILLLLIGSASGRAVERFPPPDFESGYEQPVLTFQEQQSRTDETVAAVVLLVALPVVGWVLLKRRSRKAVFALGLGALLWFGFWRAGCICPVGAVQNVTVGLFGTRFHVPLAVIALFLLPLVFALICGRVFCGAICPLGMAQDITLWRPRQVPQWLDDALGMMRFFVLGLVVYIVLVQDRFALCRLDPFVGFFRLSGAAWLLGAGGLLLVLGMWIGRPYCRYLCPYGALLSLFSRWSATGVRVTPDVCINCALCDEACPFGAIRRPTEPAGTSLRFRLSLWVLAALALPGLAMAGWTATGRTRSGLLLGLWFGLVIGAKLVSLTFSRERTEYEADHAKCLSCGRCYEYCPREHVRRAEEAGDE